LNMRRDVKSVLLSGDSLRVYTLLALPAQSGILWKNDVTHKTGSA